MKNQAKDNNRRVGIFLGTYQIKDSYLKTTKEISEIAGYNTGNFLFRFAVDNHIACHKTIIDFSTDIQFIKENIDIIVIPSANQMNPNWDLSGWANFLEKCDLPVLVLGLGCQAPSIDYTDKIELKPGTIRYLQIISEKSKRIGVRGSLTAEQLSKYGINNVVVMGCPSNLINPKNNLGLIIEKKLIGKIDKLVVASGEFHQTNQEYKICEQKLLEWVSKYNGLYTCQSPQNLIALGRGRINEVEHQTKYLGWLKGYLMPKLSYEDFLSFVKKRFICFPHVEAWLEFLSSCDLSVGKRIHGNIAAIQTEVPGICIIHDSRTQELCNTLKIPHISLTNFLAIKDLEELIEKIEFDGSNYDKNRQELLQVYKSLLEENDIPCSL